MKYPKRYTRIITEYYSSLRAKEEQDQILRCHIARKDPEFRQAEKAFSEASLTFARAKILSNSYADERKKYENAKQKLNNICENKGYDLTLHIHCKKCQDTGFIGEELCSCALPMYFDLLKQDFGTKNIPKISFENNRINEINCLQKHSLAILYDRMQDLCDKFYTTEKLTILITGQSGTGKTTLAYTMAKEIKKNATVLDLGTGTGIISILLSKKTASQKIYGIEVQKDVADMARRSVKLNRITRKNRNTSHQYS